MRTTATKRSWLLVLVLLWAARASAQPMLCSDQPNFPCAPGSAAIGDLTAWTTNAAPFTLGSYAGSGSCGANQFFTALSSAGAKTCAQPTAAGIASGAALTKTDDTNVTATLGGTPNACLLVPASITLGWTGQLALGRGGTGQATALAAFDALSPLTTTGDVLTFSGGHNTRVAANATATKKYLHSVSGGAPAFVQTDYADLSGTSAVLTGGINIKTQAGIDCTGATDSTTGITNAITAASGATLWLPAGCRLLVASPGGDGTTNFTLPSNTALLCEDGTAGFNLARRTCATGTFVGAACHVDADCAGSGTCATEGSAGATAWAGDFTLPLGSSATDYADTTTRTLFKAAASSVNVQVRGCGFWARGTSAVQGACFTNTGSCGGASGRGNGCACSANGQCTSGLCATGDHPMPVGAGNVNLLDLSAATGALVSDVTFYDHRYGALGISTGGSAVVRDNHLDRIDVAQTAALGQHVNTEISVSDTYNTPSLTVGLQGSLVKNNTLRPYAFGVKFGSYTLVDGNVVYGDTQSGAHTIAFYALGQQSRIVNNYADTAYTCIQGDGGLNGLNNVFANNRCYSGNGPKVKIAGAGWIINGNYLAWGSVTAPGALIEIGDPGEADCTAAGLPYAGCTGSGTGQVAGGGATHPIVTNNLLYSQSNNVKYVKMADVGKRCTASTNWPALVGMACTVGNCASGNCQANGTCVTGGAACCDNAGGTGACGATSIQNGEIVGNVLLPGGTGTTGVDFTALTSGNTTVQYFSVQANQIGTHTGVGFPTSPVAGTFSTLRVANNAFIVNDTAGVTHFPWTDTANTQFGNAGLLPADDQVTAINLTNQAGGTLTAGNIVDVQTGNDNAMTTSALASQTPLGVVLDAPTNTSTGQVANNGLATCNVDGIAVNRGDRLKASPITAGKLTPADIGEPALAVAVTAAAAQGTSVRCAVGPVPANTDSATRDHRTWTVQERDQIGSVAVDTAGIDSAVNTAVVPTAATDSPDTTGDYITYDTTATTQKNAGWISSRFSLVRANLNPEFTAVIQTGATLTSVRYFIGLTSGELLGADTAAGTKTPAVATGQNGAGYAAFRFDTVATADTVWHCDDDTGSGTPNDFSANTLIPAPAANTRYVMKIRLTSSAIKWYINGLLACSDASPKLASTTSLGYEVGVKDLSASARQIRISLVNLEHL